MENTNEYRLSTWGSLWKWIGIDRHAYYGSIYLISSGKYQDIRDWCLYWVGYSKQKPPLFGETEEGFFVRKVYSTSYDCFHRPICSPAGTHIVIGLREEKEIENEHHLVLKKGATKEAINFGSYNYLGFGGVHPIVTKEIINTLNHSGSVISAFASEIGISKEQQKLEKTVADFLHKEDAIVVSMGYATNSTLIPILAGKGDVIFSDALNHSSMIFGMKSSKAEIKVFKHNDIRDLKQKLEDLKNKGMKNGQQPNKVIVIVEGLYSMEGEFCPLKEIIALKKAYGFYLYVDEAHSICALGKTGRGIVEQTGCSFDDVDILMGTFSKSFASAGGYIASDKKTIELLRSNCYSYVYGNPMSPVEAQQIESCFELIKSEEGKRRITQLRKNAVGLRTKFKEAGCHVLGDLDSPVIPVMVYHPCKLKDISRACLKNGIAIVVVGFPACPITACRIRFCVSAAHTDEDIEKCFKVTMDALKETSSVFNNIPEPKSVYHAQKVDLAELEALPKEPRKMKPLYESSDKFSVKPRPLPVKGLNLISYDIHDFEEDKIRNDEITKTLNFYGCGSCGPRGFYGTTLEHLNLEEKLMEFFGTNEAVIYSYGCNTLTSVIPVYGKKGNVVLIDEYCNYPIQVGCRLSKGKIVKFNHNDINDLKEKLAEVKKTIGYGLIIIVTEGVFQCDYSIAPLKEYSALRDKNVMLIVDDSLGIGALGKNLKGTLEHYDMTMNDVDMLCGSLEFVCNTVGGFVVGKYSVINKQRLFGAGYIFSASSPPFTCVAGRYALEKYEKEGKEMREEIIERRRKFDSIMEQSNIKNVKIISDRTLPYVMLNCEGRNDELVKKLRDNDISATQLCHIEDDWCQNYYVRMNLGKNVDEKEMKKIGEVLSDF